MQIREETTLFRPDAVDAQSARLHGEVILRQSLPTRIVTLGILLVVIAALAWIVLGRYARIETARGVLMPASGYSKVFAPRPGVVTSLLVRDGDDVKAGQKLVVVRMESPDASGGMGTEKDLESISNQTALANQQIGLAGERSRSEVSRLSGVIDGLRSQIVTLQDQVALQRQIVASMADSFGQIAPAVEKGYISKLESERRRQALLSAQEDLSRLRQQVASAQADIARTEKERSQAALMGRNDQDGARLALENLRQQRTRVEGEGSYSIEAPVSGRITMIQTGAGRTVESAVPLMVVVPDSASLRAELFVPSRAIGFVRRGQEVRLLYDAFPYQRFGSYVAHVETISRLAVAGQETGAPFDIKEPVYRVTARLDRQQIDTYGERTALQPGMTLNGNLVLERQSFLDWMLDPLRSVSNRN